MAIATGMQIDFRKFCDVGSVIEVFYEDEQCLAFDAMINQQAPVHFLVVPKKVIPRLSDASVQDEKLIGYLLVVSKKIAVQKGLHQVGYHVVIDEDYKTKKLNAIHVFGRSLFHMLWSTGLGSRL